MNFFFFFWSEIDFFHFPKRLVWIGKFINFDDNLSSIEIHSIVFFNSSLSNIFTFEQNKAITPGDASVIQINVGFFNFSKFTENLSQILPSDGIRELYSKINLLAKKKLFCGKKITFPRKICLLFGSPVLLFGFSSFSVLLLFLSLLLPLLFLGGGLLL